MSELMTPSGMNGGEEPSEMKRECARVNEGTEVAASPIMGFLNVDKPAGMTSHDVVARLRRWTKIKRIGHAGTLDPDATGVLPLAIGPACRSIQYLSHEKIYFAEILLGVQTTTDDISGTIIERKELSTAIDEDKIRAALENFIGEIEQKPPLYSAVHHKGKRLYQLAREKNSDLSAILSEVKIRLATVYSIDLLSIDLPVLQLRITCAGGTYIRSIARDLGELLGCGGCLKLLRREKSGPFVIGQAIDLDSLQRTIENGKLSEILTSPELQKL